MFPVADISNGDAGSWTHLRDRRLRSRRIRSKEGVDKRQGVVRGRNITKQLINKLPKIKPKDAVCLPKTGS